MELIIQLMTSLLYIRWALVKAGDGNYYSRKETFYEVHALGDLTNTTSEWYGYDKSGTRYTFTSRKGIHGVTAVWALTRVADVYGNGYTVSYSTDTITFEYADRKVVVKFISVGNSITKYSYNSVFPDNSIVNSIVITARNNLTRTYSFTYDKDLNGQEILSKIDKSESINGVI